MRTRTLGRTGLSVSELAAGGLFLSQWGGEFEQSKQALLRAVDLGVNYINTAPGYANSEEVIGRILEDNTRPFILSTKLGGRPQPFNPLDKEALFKSCEESLRLLKRDQIDILMVHEPDRPAVWNWWTDAEHYQGPVIEVLADLKRQGLVKFTGLDGVTAYELAPIIRSNPDITCTLMGARPIQEVELNLAAIEKGPLPPDVLQRLDAIAALVLFRPLQEPPYFMPFAKF